MKLRHTLWILGFSALVFSIGCGDPQPTNVLDGIDSQALSDYDAMIAADEKAATEDTGDSEDAKK